MPTATPAAHTPAPPRRRGFGWTRWSIGICVAVAAPAALLGTLAWTLGTDRGTAWALAQQDWIEVNEPQGNLLGGFSAKRIVISWGAQRENRVIVDAPRASGLNLAPGGNQTWLRIHAAQVSAQQVSVQLAPGNSAPQLPPHLRLPIEIEVDAASLGTLELPGLQAHAFRQVSGRVHLGADQGALHRADALRFAIGPLQFSGSAQIGTASALQLRVNLEAAQATDAPAPRAELPNWARALRQDWQARLDAQGPLARFGATLALRAQGQRLDAQAEVAPLEAWPLPRLDAHTEHFDLSAVLAHVPATALSGTLHIAPLADRAGTLSAQARLVNERPGRWDRQSLPVRTLELDMQMQPGALQQLEFVKVQALLADETRDAGQVQGSGQWNAGAFSAKATLAKVQPNLLDPRLATMTLSGPLAIGGQLAPAPRIDVQADLKGRLDRHAAAGVEIKVDVAGTELHLEVRELLAKAGAMQLMLSGTARRTTLAAPWQLEGKTKLSDFDPLPWFPGEPDTAWRRGPHRFTGDAEFAFTVPSPAQLPVGVGDWLEWLPTLQGEARMSLHPSQLAGVALRGEAALKTVAPDRSRFTAKLEAAGNALTVQGEWARGDAGRSDQWSIGLSAPQLAGLAALRLLSDVSAPWPAPRGAVDASLKLEGRWPQLHAEGTMNTEGLRIAEMSVARGQANWSFGHERPQADDIRRPPPEGDEQSGKATFAHERPQADDIRRPPSGLQAGRPSPATHERAGARSARAQPPEGDEQSGKATFAQEPDSPVELSLDLTDARWNQSQAQSVRVSLLGTARAHTLELRAALNAAPPAIAELILGNRPVDDLSRALTLVKLDAQGALLTAPDAATRWQGTVHALDVRSNAPQAAALLMLRDAALLLNAGDSRSAPAIEVQPGRGELLGARLRWERARWSAASPAGPAQFDLQAELEPVAVSPWLARAQPHLGWSGDLALGGHVRIRSAPDFAADIVLERTTGDLSVSDETGTQPLQLTDLRLALSAQEGVWSLTQALAGKTLGEAAGAVTARVAAPQLLPSADTPIQGVLQARVANLGTWGAWVPPGWRLAGSLNTSAVIGGRLGAPEYTGQIRGTDIGVRNIVQGVNVVDGDVDIKLQGLSARIERFEAKAGGGSVRLEGAASLGETPNAQLVLRADRFQLLGRVDRRLVASGSAKLRLDAQALSLDGRFKVDEGLIDFTRGDAPTLADDVRVAARTGAVEPGTEPQRGAPAGPGRNVALDLQVALGEQLRLRGRGLDTQLRGDLRLTTPGNKLAINGTLRTAAGTYAAYGQKLSIERGELGFTGAAENPRLDIIATRPNLEQVVGVAVTGTALNPRVRLFSEPEMADIDKLSWLVLGRASDGLGRTDTALLQRAAIGLLAGEGTGPTDQLIGAIGLDEVSFRQTEGEVRETVVSLGKQLSRRWYVGYERSLNATTGNWQLIYRIAQRLTLRAQSGLDNSLDAIWTWRWQ